MCVSTRPSRMSDTIVYAAWLSKLNRHALAYQNKAASSGPNVMILPVPSKRPLERHDFLDMTPYKGFLRNYAEAHRPRTRSLGVSRSAMNSAPRVQQFRVGSYAITSAPDAASLQGYVDATPELLATYARLYPRWPVVLCQWEGEVQAEPVMLTYESFCPNFLYFPMLDGHDGYVDTKARPLRDHVLVAATDHPTRGSAWVQGGVPDALRHLFPSNAITHEVDGTTSNEDFYVRCDAPYQIVESPRPWSDFPCT